MFLFLFHITWPNNFNIHPVNIITNLLKSRFTYCLYLLSANLLFLHTIFGKDNKYIFQRTSVSPNWGNYEFFLRTRIRVKFYLLSTKKNKHFWEILIWRCQQRVQPIFFPQINLTSKQVNNGFIYRVQDPTLIFSGLGYPKTK